MMWGKKKPEPIRPTPQAAVPPIPPDELISRALAAYQHHFYETEKGQPDPSVEEAKATVARANKIVSESRIGYSMCALMKHVKHWHAWSQRDDFSQYAGFPVKNVHGTQDKTDGKRPHDRVIIHFDYRDTPYTLVFIDEGMPNWSGDDYNRYGTVELFSSQDLLVGLDISCDTSKGIDYERWHFSQVSAFAPGEWMKHVVEMAAHIDAHQSRQIERYSNDDALKRASRIKL
jgi:hypothetical protein